MCRKWKQKMKFIFIKCLNKQIFDKLKWHYVTTRQLYNLSTNQIKLASMNFEITKIQNKKCVKFYLNPISELPLFCIKLDILSSCATSGDICELLNFTVVTEKNIYIKPIVSSNLNVVFFNTLHDYTIFTEIYKNEKNLYGALRITHRSFIHDFI